MKLRCEICSATIGEVELATLALPLTSEMFGSADKAHGYPPPFNPGLTFETFRCPYGPHRPMILPDRLLTEEGYVVFHNGEARLLIGNDDPVAREVADRDAAEKAAERLAREQLGYGDVEKKTNEIVTDIYKDRLAADGAHVCSICGKQFSAEKFLKMHVTKKHGEAKDAGNDHQG